MESNRYIVLVCMAMVMCLLAPFFSYARAQHALGTSATSAPVIADTVSANIVDGTANYFKIAAANLPAMVYYWPDTAFGPLPTLINATGTDTIPAQMAVEGCRMGWRWQLAAAVTEQEVRCLYFSAHENASAEIRPYVCNPTTSDTTATACDSLMWKGEWRKESGDYEYKTTNAAGCDSIVTLHLTINHPTSGDTTATACESFTWYGTTYTESAEPKHTLAGANSNGCDSIVTLHLTINHPTTGEETETACDSLFWKGEWRKASGDYTYKTTNAAGCDSTVTLHLTIKHSVSVVLKDTTLCETEDGYEYIWGDTTITKAGTYTRHFKTALGCDSAVTQTVHFLAMTYGTTPISIVAYDRYTSNMGIPYTKSQIGAIDFYTNAAGCDSVVTLDITIRHLQVNDTVKHSICDSELPYKWYGKTYTESGTYSTDTILGAKENGVYMDTVHTVNLTVLSSSKSEETHSAESSYTWHDITYEKSGNYTYTTTNAVGCDSVVTLHLTISHPVDTIPAYFCPKSGIVEHVDVTSNPRIHYIPYEYEKPSKEWYMEGVVTDESNSGAYVNFLLAQENLQKHYVEPLTPVMVVYWRYRQRNASSQTEVVINRTQPQWVETGTISIEVQFQCGQRFYDSFTVGNMTEGTEQVSGEEQAIKRMENGQVVIIRNGAKYTILGTKIQ